MATDSSHRLTMGKHKTIFSETKGPRDFIHWTHVLSLIFQHGMFGGWYKEAIVVSCFSKKRYKEARQIMLELEATRQKVNGLLFGQCCGLKDETALYQLLRRMAQGEMSKEDFSGGASKF